MKPCPEGCGQEFHSEEGLELHKIWHLMLMSTVQNKATFEALRQIREKLK